jgi:hypothetical protein
LPKTNHHLLNISILSYTLKNNLNFSQNKTLTQEKTLTMAKKMVRKQRKISIFLSISVTWTFHIFKTVEQVRLRYQRPVAKTVKTIQHTTLMSSSILEINLQLNNLLHLSSKTDRLLKSITKTYSIFLMHQFRIAALIFNNKNSQPTKYS